MNGSDDLTGLPTRGSFLRCLADQIEATAPEHGARTRLCLLIIDLDHLKTYNDHYSHALAQSRRPERLFQVLHPDLPAAFPPLASARAPLSNLPVALSSFIGRSRERTAVAALLQSSRLVTLTGTGGAGKTP